MEKNKFLIGLSIFLLVAGAIFMSGCQKTQPVETRGAKTGAKTVQYWTCAMHPSVKSDKPGKCPICGMDLIPVEKQPEVKKEEIPAERKIVYYRNPMDPSSASPTPIKDSMGMDYIPVYEDEAEKDVYYGCGTKEFGHCPKCDEGKPDAQCICGEHKYIIKGVKMTCPVCKRELKELSKEEAPTMEANVVGSLSLTERQQQLSGIATVTISKQDVFKEIRTVGKIAYDPELAVAQEEFLIALQTLEKVKDSSDVGTISRAQDLVEKSKFRLRLLGMSDEQITELETTKESQRNLILPEDKVWVYADVYEYELSWIKEGLDVKVTSQSYPGEEFEGRVKAINPVLDPNTRSVKVRLEINNPEKKLKPEMFVDVFIRSDLGKVLAVPKEAILDTGTRKIVWVAKSQGNFQAREIKTGPEGIALVDNQEVRVFPVLNGLNEGEQIVTKGNFLLDSQSQLTTGMSVLWGGATEIKETAAEQTQEAAPQSQHRH